MTNFDKDYSYLDELLDRFTRYVNQMVVHKRVDEEYKRLLFEDIAKLNEDERYYIRLQTIEHCEALFNIKFSDEQRQRRKTN